jgi:hypothetical protein
MMEKMKELVRVRVAEGFSSRESILDHVTRLIRAVEGVADQDLSDLVKAVRDATDAALAAQAAAQASWPVVTDCDRLERAFAALELDGIVARQNFTCCQSCGLDKIDEELGDPPARGFVFYHWQDLERAVKGHGLYLTHGAADGEAASAINVGKTVASALELEGLKVEWDGSAENRILVAMDWKKRRVPAAAPIAA